MATLDINFLWMNKTTGPFLPSDIQQNLASWAQRLEGENRLVHKVDVDAALSGVTDTGVVDVEGSGDPQPYVKARLVLWYDGKYVSDSAKNNPASQIPEHVFLRDIRDLKVGSEPEDQPGNPAEMIIPKCFFPECGAMDFFAQVNGGVEGDRVQITIPEEFRPKAPGLGSLESLLGYMDQPLSPLHRDTSKLGWFFVIDFIKAAIICRGESYGQLVLDVDIQPLSWHDLVGYTSEDEPSVPGSRWNKSRWENEAEFPHLGFAHTMHATPFNVYELLGKAGCLPHHIQKPLVSEDSDEESSEEEEDSDAESEYQESEGAEGDAEGSGEKAEGAEGAEEAEEAEEKEEAEESEDVDAPSQPQTCGWIGGLPYHGPKKTWQGNHVVVENHALWYDRRFDDKKKLLLLTIGYSCQTAIEKIASQICAGLKEAKEKNERRAKEGKEHEVPDVSLAGLPLLGKPIFMGAKGQWVGQLIFLEFQQGALFGETVRYTHSHNFYMRPHPYLMPDGPSQFDGEHNGGGAASSDADDDCDEAMDSSNEDNMDCMDCDVTSVPPSNNNPRAKSKRRQALAPKLAPKSKSMRNLMKLRKLRMRKVLPIHAKTRLAPATL